MTRSFGRRETPLLATVMSREVVSVPLSATLGDAASRMEQLHIGSVLVLDGERPAGILTEHDITRALGDGRPVTDGVATVMTGEILSLPETTPVHAAFRTLIGHNIRHLLVTDDTGRMAGVVSDTDLRFTDGLDLVSDPVTVGRVMDRDPLCLTQTDTVRTAARAMRVDSSRHVLVVDAAGAVCGVVSERDMVRLFREGQFEAPLHEIMSRPLLTIAESADLVEAATLMRAHHVRMLVALGPGGRLAGILHEKHLVRRIEDAYVGLLQQIVADQARALEQMGISGLVEDLPQGLAFKDQDLVYRSVNAAFAAELGLPREAIIGRRDADLLPPAQAAAEAQADARTLAGGGISVVEEPVERAGATVWYRVTRRPIRGGDVSGLLVLRDDITAMRAATEALRRHG